MSSRASSLVPLVKARDFGMTQFIKIRLNAEDCARSCEVGLRYDGRRPPEKKSLDCQALC
jgi:hypothetical protein